PTFRRFAHLRRRLVPYLAAQARQSINTGWPLVRALGVSHPDDPGAWRHPLHFYLGDDLLVAPVTEPGAIHAGVYLPPGRWIDVWSSSIVTGGRDITVPAPIDRIP